MSRDPLARAFAHVPDEWFPPTVGTHYAGRPLSKDTGDLELRLMNAMSAAVNQVLHGGAGPLPQTRHDPAR